MVLLGVVRRLRVDHEQDSVGMLMRARIPIRIELGDVEEEGNWIAGSLG